MTDKEDIWLEEKEKRIKQEMMNEDKPTASTADAYRITVTKETQDGKVYLKLPNGNWEEIKEKTNDVV